jgi:hypothetical protein
VTFRYKLPFDLGIKRGARRNRAINGRIRINHGERKGVFGTLKLVRYSLYINAKGFVMKRDILLLLLLTATAVPAWPMAYSRGRYIVPTRQAKIRPKTGRIHTEKEFHTSRPTKDSWLSSVTSSMTEWYRHKKQECAIAQSGNKQKRNLQNINKIIISKSFQEAQEKARLLSLIQELDLAAMEQAEIDAFVAQLMKHVAQEPVAQREIMEVLIGKQKDRIVLAGNNEEQATLDWIKFLFDKGVQHLNYHGINTLLSYVVSRGVDVEALPLDNALAYLESKGKDHIVAQTMYDTLLKYRTERAKKYEESLVRHLRGIRDSDESRILTSQELAHYLEKLKAGDINLVNLFGMRTESLETNYQKLLAHFNPDKYAHEYDRKIATEIIEYIKQRYADLTEYLRSMKE